MGKIFYRKDYKYQLIESYNVQTGIIIGERKNIISTDFITLYPDGELFIRRFFAWDGPSGPTIDTKNFMRGSLIHDALYQILRSGELEAHWRPQADLELWKACREDGMSHLRAWWVYYAVRKFGKKAAMAESKKKILTAP